ncbi:methyltransferase [Bermanella marisrubri]|uniref:rRNA (Guanine-N(2)-)-methyltransferase n=1 Tax=Bermanella marisrubri TaxID=207949 RepID=Q1N4Z1_9GAMM|nr:class I SAM-dependent methyltransferase [Bermanella marisrubri]EAT13287.1 rRNA (guanine-N(2)-)-methyltransferase [Oceanobacter sp. RED65] [Bermanella marisrubri]QIZ84050.1 methyltransferase [Bermanella marisrubri]
MDTLNIAGRTLKLVRPGTPAKLPLRPWDAADEYIINEAQDLAKITIINDGFGALGCVLSDHIDHWISDSACASDALNSNLNRNGITAQFHILSPMQMQNANGEVAAIKLPRNASYNHYLIEQLIHQGYREIWFAGMMKHLPKNLLSFLQQFGNVQRLPFVKKATIFKLAVDTPNVKSSGYPKQLNIHGQTLWTHANVFGRDKLDLGAEFFLQHFKSIQSQCQKAQPKVADLCAGSGILGLKFKELAPDSELHFYDESAMAIESCQLSWQANQTDSNVAFHWQDGLENAEPVFDLILCNPPFHENNTVSDHIARRLFKQAKQALAEQGQLYIVANRHLPYQSVLQRMFKHVNQVAQNKKFVILHAHD